MIQANSHIRTLESEFQSLLQTDWLGRHTRFIEHIDSTSSEAMQWAGENAPDGAIVFAEHQTAGRGRHGRAWRASPSNNLLFSLILKPSLPPPWLGLITIAASLAIANTIDTFIAPTTSRIKWPNDILINGKKCCGMLLESIISNRQETHALPVVLGVGLNVNQTVYSDPIGSTATSLLLETGRHIPRMGLLAAFLANFESRYHALSPDRCEGLLQAYQSKLAFLEEDVSLRFIGRTATVSGRIKGVTKTGALRLETADGIEAYHAGEVTCGI